MARLKCITIALLACCGACLLLVMFTPLVPWTAGKLSYNWTDSDGDILIVLGAGNVEHSTLPQDVMIGESSYWRSIYAARAWGLSHFQTVILSGAGTSLEMKRFLIAYGVPEQAILTENHSASTRENALLVKPLLEGRAGRRVLMTSDYHMFRAARVFQRAGIEVIPRPIPDLIKRSASNADRWPAFWTLMSELSKIVYYKFSGWM